MTEPNVTTSSMKPAQAPTNGEGKPEGKPAPEPAPVSSTAATSPPKPPRGSSRKRRSSAGPSSKGSAAAKGRKKKEPDPADFEWAGRAMFVSRELGYETPEAFIADCKDYAAAWDRVHGK